MAATPANSLITVARPTTLHRGDAVTGALAMNHPIRVSIALKVRNREGLDSFIANNAKARASHPMTHDQFMANHAPTQLQAQTVANYLTNMGFKNVVIAPNRMMVSADGTAASAGNAFLTSFKQVKTRDGRIAFANNSEARVPASLGGTVLAVLGLQTANQAHVFARKAKQQDAHTMSITGHNPVEFSSIYGGTGVPTGAGVTAGIFTNGDVSASITDLNTFTSNNGLAAVTTQVVKTNGGGSDTGGHIEWDIDSQDLVGMAGGEIGKLIFYTAPSLSFDDMNDNFNTIVNANEAKVVNVSIGGCELNAQESGAAATSDQILAVGAAQGQTFTISTGDDGADECGDGGVTPSWPADSPYVVAVSGTTLDASTGGSAAWADETVWGNANGATGGSPSTFEPKPYWQETLVPGDFRGVADVAFAGDPNSGAIVNVGSGTQQWGGTSLAAPIFAGWWARVLAVKGTDIGFAAPLIYSLPQSDFHDVTVGNNFGENAEVGYDFATGRGSVVLNTAISHLGEPVGNPPVANFSYVAHGLKVNFTDTSTDSDGTIVKHFWGFGDGSAPNTSANPVHTYVGAGTYTVSETVIDNDLNAVTKSIKIDIVPAGGANQLIANTGFETGTDPWTMSPGTRSNTAPHAGAWDARLDGQGTAHTDTVSQTVRIPGHKTSATLSFWLHVDTNEVTTTRKFDKLSVAAYSPSGILLGTVASFSNLDKGAGYTEHSYDMSGFIGQTIKLKFIGTEDASIATAFTIDDVTLLAK